MVKVQILLSYSFFCTISGSEELYRMNIASHWTSTEITYLKMRCVRCPMREKGDTMIYNAENKPIEEIFYRQIREISSRNIIKTLDTFNEQFSGRCFL